MNSKLSQGERFDQFERAKAGDIDIMIGPRSALFTPFPHLGLIIIDEEHETSYKSETAPRYHARDVAIERARMNDASVLLGSATPSVDSYYQAMQGKYQLLTLSERVEKKPLPDCEVVDLRSELRAGNRSIFSERLQELMEDRLKKRQQIMLFLNRRGISGFISCRACGYVIQCPHCDVSLSQHAGGRMVCHYCGYEQTIGKIGEGMFGKMLTDILDEIGIDHKGLIVDPYYNTTLAFVKNFENGDREFSFYRHPGADMMLKASEVAYDLIRQAEIFHFGTLSMTDETVREATIQAIALAKEQGLLISFDPNLRPPLWKSMDEAKVQIAYGLGQCDVLKISDNEIEFMTDTSDFDEGVQILMDQYPNIRLLNLTYLS